ncbi:hypothetical protein BACCOP_03397 [Phocaeicola coprocola DSM 17136]|uniref:Uncharacterized protein n=1 Tax=Phocaeicola coprocola DSM 17136 TaxID=470145 RepID=B3JN85_9BACT|nr:hypothetical protein BACCOP_03397 [Phocaeicola coprocola DSM 17136]
MPLLLLVWREKQHHAVVQFYLAKVQQQVTICFAKEVEAEEVRLEPPVFGQHGANILICSGIDVKIHTAIRLAERNADQLFGVDNLFHTLAVCAKVMFLFIKMAYICNFLA